MPIDFCLKTFALANAFIFLGFSFVLGSKYRWRFAKRNRAVWAWFEDTKSVHFIAEIQKGRNLFESKVDVRESSGSGHRFHSVYFLLLDSLKIHTHKHNNCNFVHGVAKNHAKPSNLFQSLVLCNLERK